jgi:RNA polymerase sigma-70 factor (ECF subfamily)
MEMIRPLSLNPADPITFKEIYTRFYPQIFFFGCTLVEREEAKDIAVEAFAQLWNARKQFDSMQKVKTYLQVCVRNAAINARVKRRNNEKKVHEFLTLYRGCDEIASEQELTREDLISLIANEIDKLPPGARKIILLSFFKGMNSRKIAKQLHLSESTVRNQKKRALDLLRLALSRIEFFFVL